MQVKGHTLTEMRTDLIEERAVDLSCVIHEKGAPLHSCIGFVDCTKIYICRPGGGGAMKRSCHSGHKLMH